MIPELEDSMNELLLRAPKYTTGKSGSNIYKQRTQPTQVTVHIEKGNFFFFFFIKKRNGLLNFRKLKTK